MSVWIVCPSARPPEHVEKWARAWREQGYRIALMFDSREAMQERVGSFDRAMTPNAPHGYQGYAESVNALVFAVSTEYADAEWFIAAGDDIFPDPNKSAEEIAHECGEHFRNLNGSYDLGGAVHDRGPTFGVMQPTGDRWGEDPDARDPAMRSAYIDRVAGSAWFGREYCRRVNGGRGPLWPEYQHMFVDEEARAVAVKLGVYWERPDLTHYHDHWGRPKTGERFGDVANMPEFLKEANSTAHWKKYKTLFEQRRDAGFPGSEPL